MGRSAAIRRRARPDMDMSLIFPAWLLKGYPYLVFYIERDSHIDVWRVLHAQQDIPAWLQATQA